VIQPYLIPVPNRRVVESILGVLEDVAGIAPSRRLLSLIVLVRNRRHEVRRRWSGVLEDARRDVSTIVSYVCVCVCVAGGGGVE
jgi:hypothetical protein